MIGAVNGLFATRLKLNPLIVTLGMMSIVSGSALILTGGLTRPLMVPGFNWIGQGRFFGDAGAAHPDGRVFIVLSVVLGGRALAASSMRPAAMPRRAG